MPVRVLVANPDPEVRQRTAQELTAQGIAAEEASSGAQCLAMLAHQEYQVLLSDLDLGDLTAEELLEQARRRQAGLRVIVASDQGSRQEVVRLVRCGLDDYLPARLPAEELARRLREAAGLVGKPEECPEIPLTGRSRAIREVIEIIRLIAPKRSTVLITGPTGTGKELVARSIHALSPRAAAAMVTVNCGAIPENLLEAEFFGHMKGAFTGAIGSRTGRFEQAHGSTLFLDEIGEMPFGLQAKVLRAVQEREFQPVGSSETRRVDVRIIAASNSDLGEKVRRGEFREDLYYRLNVVPIVMPSLADRIEDLPLLVENFLEKVCREEATGTKRVNRATLDRLQQYHWPGNIRQLENAVEKAVVLSGDREELYPSDFPLPVVGPARGQTSDPEVRLPAGGLDFEALVGRIERSLLEQALCQAAGNKKRAAELLRLKRTTLSAKWRKIRE